MDQLLNRISKLEEENARLRTDIQRNTNYIQEIDQYIRRESLEIHNIPDCFDQTVLERFVIDLAGRIGVHFSSYEVAACHRLHRRKGERYAPVIIRFTNRKFVQSLMDARHLLPIRTQYYWGKVFFTENLIPPRRKVLAELRSLKCQGLIDHCGSWNGVPYFRCDGAKYQVTDQHQLRERVNQIAPD